MNEWIHQYNDAASTPATKTELYITYVCQTLDFSDAVNTKPPERVNQSETRTVLATVLGNINNSLVWNI